MPFKRKVQVDIVPAGSPVAIRVENLRVSFDVQKDVKTSANHATVKIYNLSQDTRAKFHELTDQIIVRAGYADESMDEIFHGDLISVSHPKDGADIITVIEANDGQGALRNSFSSVSYGENTGVGQVMRDLSKQMGIPIKTQDYLKTIGADKFLNGFSFNGRTKDALDKVAARAGLEWSVQGNQLQIIKLGGVLPKDPSQIPLITPETGLMGSPERLIRVRSESPEKKPPGWKIKSCLIGRLEPGGQVGLQSKDVPRAMAFRIETVQHQGDTHGDDFYTLVEALDPGILLASVGVK